MKVNNMIFFTGTLAPAKLKAVAKPSGILCNPITIAKVIPKASSEINDDPIDKPYGKLCSNILMKIKYPDFISPVKSSLFFINIVNNTPINVNSTV